jgi:hypothetical protein
MPLVADRGTYTAPAGLREIPVVDNVVIYEGALVAVDTNGYARPARVSTTDKVIGIAEERADNTGVGHANGAIRIRVRSDRVAFFKNSTSTDAISIASVGADCFVVADDQVALTNGTNTRCRAGKIYDVLPDGQVGVRFDQ